MNLDIVQVQNGMDLGFAVSTIPKAFNVVQIQVGELEYASDFGIDKRYFLTSPVNFQPESYRAHVVEKLTRAQVVTTDALILIEAVYNRLTLGVDSTGNSVKGLIK